MLFNFGSFPALAEQISRDPGLIFVSGILLFVAGLAIVRAHNIWTGGWPVLVTVLGWLTVLGDLLRMLFPTQLAAMVARVDQSSGRIIMGRVSFWCWGLSLIQRATAATKQALAPQRQSDLTRRHSRFHTWRAFAGEGNAA